MSVLLFDGPAARGFTRAGGDVGKTSAKIRWLRGDQCVRFPGMILVWEVFLISKAVEWYSGMEVVGMYTF